MTQLPPGPPRLLTKMPAIGCLASYVIISNGQVEIFDSSGGAYVWNDMFWGPDLAEVFIRLHPSRPTLLADHYCEGGLGLNFDTAELLIFDGGEFQYDLYWRSVYLRLLAGVWPGWSVRCATDGVLDLADFFGLARELVGQH